VKYYPRIRFGAHVPLNIRMFYIYHTWLIILAYSAKETFGDGQNGQ
jgi:hypothetical protein